MTDHDELLTINEASRWATDYVGKNVTAANISYLIQYGRVRKIGENGATVVSRAELHHYYDSINGAREINFKTRLGADLNWELSFDQYKEAETTKHVHRLHPYKGKFIPQLVAYFLDNHHDKFKPETYFSPNDIILDPFSGSGTTMVQACELGMHAIGIEISAFNALMGNCKVMKYDFAAVQTEIERITTALKTFLLNSRALEFEEKLERELNIFNHQYFPAPDYKYRLRQGEINEAQYGAEKENEFLPVYQKLVQQYDIKLRQDRADNFLSKWYSQPVRDEIELVFSEIKKIKHLGTKKIISVILSRTIRSCRATTHADLATLVEPMTTTYYCAKHGKVCKPLFSILKWWESYGKDTLQRLAQFDRLRTNTFQYCLTGDSRSIDIFAELAVRNASFAEFAKKQKIKGIFSSPPYVGLINYHEQHAYAYDLFGFTRQDEAEIGALFKGHGKEAQQSYVQGISAGLNNCKKYLAPGYHVFLVTNDKNHLYPTIAENAGMKIVNQFKRPVLHRTEKDQAAYAEIIFHLQEK
jgi:hypothetical protein